MYNEVITNKLKALLTDAIAALLASQFGFLNSPISFSFRGSIATVAIILPM
ncbi:hypothetical protein [Nostoc sp.]|uniref:hypothetical protein n=1 Tax=Nostoc sp. TaxID=1180 RepID=UPI002FF6513D